MTGELYLTELYWCSFGTTLQALTVATLEEISEDGLQISADGLHKTFTAESVFRHLHPYEN